MKQVKSKMKYEIKIKYSTGNSFGSKDTSDVLELSWDNFDIAKENLKAIKNHYKNVYQQIENSYGSQKDNQEICKKYENEWWFVKTTKPYSISNDCAVDEKYNKENQNDVEYRFDTYLASNCIKLKADNGKLMQMSCFWCGYFERLQGAEIIIDRCDTKFTI